MDNPFIFIVDRLNSIQRTLEEIKQFSESDKPEKNYTVEEVAEILKVSKQSVYKYIKNGDLKASTVKRRLLISQSDLSDATKEGKSLKYRRSA